MKRLKISSLFDNLHFIFIFLILLILSLKYWYLSFLLVIYLIFIYRKTFIFLITIFFGICLILSFLQYIPNQKEELILEGVVVDLDDKSIVLNSKCRKYYVFCKESFALGDKVTVKIKKAEIKNDFFDYENYLLNQSIFGPYELIDYKVTGNTFTLSKINYFCLKRVEKHPSSYKGYINSLIFADSSDIKEIKMATTKIGVSHILAVSGMHVSLLILILEFLLKKIFYFEKPIDISIILFLFFYIIVTNFSLTVLRASLMVILTKIFKIRRLLFTKLDILSIVGIILLLIHPNTLFLLSFQLSFLISFIIIIFTSNIKISNKLINMYFMGFVSFLVGLPLIINVNYEFNLLSIILGPFFILYFELLLYPVTLLMFSFPKIHQVFIPIFEFFEYVTNYFASLTNFNIIIGSLNVVVILIYFVLLFFLLSSFELKRFRKYTISIYILFISLIYNKALFNQFLQIKFYDVGQGDSALIILPKGQGYILFDCYNNVSDFLKRDGIRKIDVIFLSHGHEDHINNYPIIRECFEVGKTYTSLYDKTLLLEKYKQKYEMSLIKSGDIIKIKGHRFYVLGPIRQYENENDNSLVIKFNYQNVSCLFTGDIEIEAEKELVNKYKSKLKSTILKVPHHGSKTSSSKLFLKYVDSKYFVVSVGKNNNYNLPNNEVILAKNNLYRTDIKGTITFSCEKKFKIKTVFR